jgi:AraC-like DNA-binding protein
MTHEVVRAPSKSVAPYLSELCGVQCAIYARPSIVLPACAPAIVVHAERDGSVRVLARGPATRAGEFSRDRLAWAAGVRLHVTSARELLGVAPVELVDQTVALDELWTDGAAALEDALARPASMDARLGVLEAGLAERLEAVGGGEPHARASVRAALRELEAGAKVAELAERIALSARQLRRHFRELVGISPMECAAIFRLQRAAESMTARGRRSLAEIALDAGYCDQAHMNLEFRKRVGAPPGAWLAASA